MHPNLSPISPKMKILNQYIAPVIALVVLLTAQSCGKKSNQWSIDGRIDGADGQVMLLEASDNGRWYPIDSVELGKSGSFSFSHDATGYPDIYRLRLGEKTLYFPIDSIETVTVVTCANAFDSEYTLAGSESAEMLMQVDRRVMDVIARGGAGAIAGDSLLKRDLGSMLLGNPSGIVSYYIINKKIGGKSIFNPSDKADLRVIGAVANAFTTYRPNDPRTSYLRNLYLSNRTVSSRDTIVAQEIPLFEVNLMDDRGEHHSLEQLARQGKVVLLSFTAYTADGSPAYNRELNKVYEQYRDRGLEIYQVSLDEDEYQWRQAARNLPWITVLNPQSTGSKVLMEYNVSTIPTLFIINRHGEISERVDDISTLASSVAKYM